MRALIIGKNGQLGSSIHKIIANSKQVDEFVFAGREELDLSKEDSIQNYFNNNSFDIIVNCAAYTSVDKAEKEIDLADQINHLAVKQLAEIANKQKAKLIHISTDYVFDGESNQPYVETDTANPINIYGKTKLAGEQAIQRIMHTNAIIIRTSWVYSDYGNNFVATMLRLGKERDKLSVVNDQVGSPTYAFDLANVILDIILNNDSKETSYTTQIYHYSNEGVISWYDFTKEIFNLAKTDCIVRPITTDEYPTLARRPKNTVMDKKKIMTKFNLTAIGWKQSLNICIALLEEKK